MSRVVADGSGRIKFPINEPAKSRAGLRSKSSWSFTAARACSTSPWQPAISSARPRHEQERRLIAQGSACLLRDAPERVGGHRRKTCAARRARASWSTATMKATCSRSSPSRSRTGRRSSSRSSSPRGPELRQGKLQGPLRGHRARTALAGDAVKMALFPEVASIRDFYAFEQHVMTCRRHRGLGMAEANGTRYRCSTSRTLRASCTTRQEVWAPRLSRSWTTSSSWPA